MRGRYDRAVCWCSLCMGRSLGPRLRRRDHWHGRRPTPPPKSAPGAPVPPPAGRHVGGVHAFAVPSPAVAASPHTCTGTAARAAVERRHSRGWGAISLRGAQTPRLTPAPRAAPRLHPQTLPALLSHLCRSVTLLLTCLGLSHYFRTNDTQRFSCVLGTLEFPLFELAYLYRLHPLLLFFFLFL